MQTTQDSLRARIIKLEIIARKAESCTCKNLDTSPVDESLKELKKQVIEKAGVFAPNVNDFAPNDYSL